MHTFKPADNRILPTLTMTADDIEYRRYQGLCLHLSNGQATVERTTGYGLFGRVEFMGIVEMR
jgi:hypothetical protein